MIQINKKLKKLYLTKKNIFINITYNTYNNECCSMKESLVIFIIFSKLKYLNKLMTKQIYNILIFKFGIWSIHSIISIFKSI